MNKKEIIEQLKANGQRLTRIKSRIIDLFIEKNQFMDASCIYNLINEEADLSTVYRNLEALYDANILDILYKDDKRWFKLYETETVKHYVVCENCSAKKELDFCPFLHIPNEIEGYVIKSHSFELIGVCPRCKLK